MVIISNNPNTLILRRLLGCARSLESLTFQLLVDACLEKEQLNNIPLIKELLLMYNSDIKRTFKLYIMEALGHSGRLTVLIPLIKLASKFESDEDITLSLESLVKRNNFLDILNALERHMLTKLQKEQDPQNQYSIRVPELHPSKVLLLSFR